MKNLDRKNLNRSSGFTLIEVVVSIGVAMLVLAAFIGIQILVRQSFLFTFNSSVTINQANGGVQQVVRGLREARSAENGSFVLDIVNDQDLAFYTDSDQDGQTERLRFFLDGTELKRGIIEPIGFPITYPVENETIVVMTEYVQNNTSPVFYYYNDDWPQDTTNNPLAVGSRLSDTRFIQIDLRVNADPSRQEAEYSLSPYVQLRNLKDNL